MGGMSSLSFENLFTPEAGGRTEGRSASDAGRTTDRLSDAWREPLAAASMERTISEASRWALSGMRRGIEGVVALAALILLAPVMFVAAFLVRLSSDGPVFFRQRRMGRHGKEFTLYKFRSMRPENGCGSCITVRGDSRITPVGAFLRRYKLDEIPQFWNVLLGDMGLVGPRPKLPHHEALHMTYRPGITGVATLAFRREEEFLSAIPESDLEAFYEIFIKPAKAQMDLEYMRNASFLSDVKLLWRTVSSCLFSSDESSITPAESIAQYAALRRRPESAGSVPHSQSNPAKRPVSAIPVVHRG